jgi:hypothetical protein
MICFVYITYTSSIWGIGVGLHLLLDQRELDTLTRWRESPVVDGEAGAGSSEPFAFGPSESNESRSAVCFN